ncbi:RNA polymerase II C-terminal domain phosphatase-like 4 isoform X1 [Cannabis sativa]|uniref:RNA polymerase II C-terminal domain phosphatase-like 4 isoform X1 n=2 Tax=Cannabis sativa TaxID=3483 RepID=UPI0029C9F0F5|nr:RNA polymerase II C-terminal domain phosphatase-like 4 isoform X1 [Cannabis sativa]XP_060970712.1 RNA polymerase II C-terminal domain phosphatase-like 4 isoform X1 [Cannabis sativa]XP_060970713.1 RNA polymerase II C-terminal domain phosphatase-like 4 isoform X1 [Cannabis sativa]XP_060970714.1 RNA polymerase II C-terminal domain phosphatase-like 4 isoform X1 [Cannabis sativa]
MDSDEGKLFIGGIAWDTTEEKLADYFGQYGEVTQTVIMRDKTTGRPRGFAFVVFSDPSVLDNVLSEKHTIDGRAMSLATDSPVNSSSSDDFASFLDTALESNSSESSPKGEIEEAEEEEEEEDIDVERVKRRKVEKLEIIKEICGSTLQESEEQKIEDSAKIDACTHPGSFGNMCILCGQRLEEESGVTFGYIHKGLRLQNDEIVRLRSTDMKNLIRHKKLCLVLDLDHTLLNSTQLVHMTSEEEYLRTQAATLHDVSDGSIFMLETMHMMTKLRPYVRSFLREARNMFELYIYTMGDRPYALAMAKLLDPKKEYFGDRIISRDDGTVKHQKGLDVVLGQESAVLILDDTENAWSKHKDNLILMERYHFFRSSCQQFGFNCKSLSELKSDESEVEGALATVLNVLKQVHSMFFDESGGDPIDRDVRQVLKTLRKEILKGCKIVFSRVFPTKCQAENHHLWKMAENLGATCVTELDPSVTHVVSTDVGTEKSRWAQKKKKLLVHPRWIEASNYMWQKQSEELFSINQVKNQ